MNAIECQAMLIRYSEATKQLDHLDEPGRWEMLRAVVCPTEELLAASMHEARRRGVSGLARNMARDYEPGQTSLLIEL